MKNPSHSLAIAAGRQAQRALNKSRNLARAGIAAGAALVGQAHAAVPEGVSTELATMKADALTVAGLVLVALIAVAAFKFMRKGF